MEANSMYTVQPSWARLRTEQPFPMRSTPTESALSVRCLRLSRLYDAGNRIEPMHLRPGVGSSSEEPRPGFEKSRNNRSVTPRATGPETSSGVPADMAPEAATNALQVHFPMIFKGTPPLRSARRRVGPLDLRNAR